MISINHNLIDKLQNNEKKIKNIKKFYLLPKNAVGKNYKVKINILVNLMIKKKIDFQVNFSKIHYGNIRVAFALVLPLCLSSRLSPMT